MSASATPDAAQSCDVKGFASPFYVKGAMLNPDRPHDWTAPVDYRNGTVHIRAEVIEKPAGGEPTTWTLCYIPNKGKGNGYGCTGTDLYREEGVYEKDVSMKEFWENDSIIWTEGIKQMDLVIKDASGGRGHAHRRKDWEKFFPTTMRITMVQVSAGSTYDPSQVPNLPRGKDEAQGKSEGGLRGTAVDVRCCAGCGESGEDGPISDPTRLPARELPRRARDVATGEVPRDPRTEFASTAQSTVAPSSGNTLPTFFRR